MRVLRSNELKAISQKYVIWSINTTITNLDYPLFVVSIFMVAIFWKKLSIAVPTALAIIQLLNSLHNISTMLSSFVSDLVAFLVFMKSIQEFLYCHEVETFAIEQRSDAEFSVKIDNGYFFWGLNEDIKIESNSCKRLTQSRNSSLKAITSKVS